MLKKDIVLTTLMEMPDQFSIDELLDKLWIHLKLEIALDQSKREQGLTLDETEKRLEKWLK